MNYKHKHWVINARGNQTRFFGDSLCTVFQNKDGNYVHVCDGEFSEEFDTEIEAKIDAEDNYGGNDE